MDGNQTQKTECLFKGVKDSYNGVIVRSSMEPCTRQVMEGILKESLKSWINSGVRGVWFEVEPSHAEWIPVLIQNGFSFHHANQELSVLLKWLPTTEKCNVPSYAHTMVGAGAMVINNNNEILVVKEKYYKKPHWKLPGGYVDPGESIPTAVRREVLEETGIETEFVSMVSFRHLQPRKDGGVFASSDLYFVAYLKPTGATDIVMCTRELENAQWMKLEEYAVHPLVHSNNQMLARQLMATFDKSDPTLPINCHDSIHPLVTATQQLYFVGKQKLDVEEKQS